MGQKCIPWTNHWFLGGGHIKGSCNWIKTMVVNELNIFKRLYNPTLIQVLSVGENIWPIKYKSISIKNNIFIKGTDIIFSLMT